MKYYSEVLHEAFDTEKECIKAEQDHADRLQREVEESKKLAEARKARAKEVENALNAVRDARKEYEKKLSDFCKDYGTFHYSWNGDNDFVTEFLTKWF